jgi:hypothetical protein
MTRVVGLLVLSSCLVPAVAGAQEIQDATIADAEAHQVVLDNEHVRVIQALAAPGHVSPMHSHPPIVIISLGTARVRMTASDGTQQFLDLHPGTVFWSDGMEHSWELLAGEVNVIGVEVKAANAAAPE